MILAGPAELQALAIQWLGVVIFVIGIGSAALHFSKPSRAFVHLAVTAILLGALGGYSVLAGLGTQVFHVL